MTSLALGLSACQHHFCSGVHGVLRSGVKEEPASRRRGTPAEQSAVHSRAREMVARNAP
jgi:hypothetical protein